MSRIGQTAPYLDGIPVVASSTERDALFPAPDTRQRVQNLATGYIERYDGASWQQEIRTGSAGVNVFNVKAAPYNAAGNGTTDDTAAINAAITACSAVGGGIVYFPFATYLVSAQIAVATAKVVLIGEKSRIYLKDNTTLTNGPSGVPTLLYINAQFAGAMDLLIDGNKATNTQDIAGVCVVGNDALLERVEVQNCHGSGSGFAGIRIQACSRTRAVHCYVHDCASDGIHVYGACVDITLDHPRAVNNGFVGIEIEGDGGSNTPLRTSVVAPMATGNSAQNLLVKFATGVEVFGSHGLAGGNNGSWKILNSNDVTFVAVRLDGTGGLSAAPHGIWIHREQDGSTFNAGSARVKLVACHLTGFAGDGIRITDSTAGIEILGCTSTGNTGFGLNVDNSTQAPAGTATRLPTNLRVIGGDYEGNTAGRIGGAFGSVSVRCLIGVQNVTQYLQGSLGIASGSHYEVNATQVLAARITGWSDPTGTLSRATFDQSTVTLPVLAQHVAQLILDLKTHGLIGT